MVKGGFYDEFSDNFYGSNSNKTESCFWSGVNPGGNRDGFKERSFSSMFGGDPVSKINGGAVKIEVDETAAEECSQRHKRTKYYLQGSPVTSTTISQVLSLHPLEEPSPLGLTLKKTPSFIELIQMNLSQRDSVVPLVVDNSSAEVGRMKDPKCLAGPAIVDKHKASNFPASVLRIGSWERISRYEGDLVAKCYYAKRKLVWEVLEGGLKSKIEVQWSDITSLKAIFPDNEPGTLEIEVSRPPLFFRETDPQPRKHTVWQATSDITGGQASICRRHLLQFAQGILERHYEKLLQCDHRLNLLSKEGIMGGNSPYFDSSGAVFQDQNEHTCYGAAHEHKSYLFPQFDHSKDNYLPPFSSLSDTGTVRVSPLVQKNEYLELDGRVLDCVPQDTPSPCSVMDSRASEESGISDADDLHVNVTAKCEQIRFAAPYGGLGNQSSDLLSPKSMDTSVNQTVSGSSEIRCANISVPIGEEAWQANKKMLDDIAQHLLSDSLLSAGCDEQKVIARVNSMHSLLEKDVSTTHASNENTESLENSGAGHGLGRLVKGENEEQVCEINDDMTEAVFSRDDRIKSQVNVMEDGYTDCKPSTGIARQDSLADLLVNIPRIASFHHLFVHSPDELITRAKQPGTTGWNPFH